MFLVWDWASSRLARVLGIALVPMPSTFAGGARDGSIEQQ